MCIIIYQPKGEKDIPKEHFDECWTSNPHGMGFCFLKGNNIWYYKNTEYRKEAWDKYKEIAAKYETPIIMHFRMGTSGNRDSVNCHPFVIDEDNMFCHNGVIKIDRKDETKSDTYTFNEMILKKLPRNFIFNEAIKKLIAKSIDRDKMAFLHSSGKVTIINKDLGHWKDGRWYSNYSYVKTNFCGYNKTWYKETTPWKNTHWSKRCLNNLVKTETYYNKKGV